MLGLAQDRFFWHIKKLISVGLLVFTTHCEGIVTKRNTEKSNMVDFSIMA